MKKYLEVLKNCPLFKNISEDNLLTMLSCLGAKTEIFDKKYTIMAEGTPAKYIGIVLSGSAQIIQVDYYGNRSILSSLEHSQVFAEAFAAAEINKGNDKGRGIFYANMGKYVFCTLSLLVLILGSITAGGIG